MPEHRKEEHKEEARKWMSGRTWFIESDVRWIWPMCVKGTDKKRESTQHCCIMWAWSLGISLGTAGRSFFTATFCVICSNVQSLQGSLPVKISLYAQKRGASPWWAITKECDSVCAYKHSSSFSLPPSNVRTHVRTPDHNGKAVEVHAEADWMTLEHFGSLVRRCASSTCVDQRKHERYYRILISGALQGRDYQSKHYKGMWYCC